MDLQILASLSQLVIAIFVWIFVTDFNFLIMICICLCLSYFIIARITGIDWKGSLLGSMSIIIIIVGLIVACFGTFLLPQAPISNSNSTNFQDLSLNNNRLTLNLSQYAQNSTLNNSINSFSLMKNSSDLNQNLTNFRILS